MKQTGEAEWAAISERERQARLLKLKREEKRLRREGKLDEAAALLGSLKDQEDGMYFHNIVRGGSSITLHLAD